MQWFANLMKPHFVHSESQTVFKLERFTTAWQILAHLESDGSNTSPQKELLLSQCHPQMQSNICSHPDNIYFSESLARFSNTTLSLMLHLLQQHSLVVEESGRWAGLAAVQTFHPLKTSGALWNEKYSPKIPAADLLSSQINTDFC